MIKNPIRYYDPIGCKQFEVAEEDCGRITEGANCNRRSHLKNFDNSSVLVLKWCGQKRPHATDLQENNGQIFLQIMSLEI